MAVSAVTLRKMVCSSQQKTSYKNQVHDLCSLKQIKMGYSPEKKLPTLLNIIDTLLIEFKARRARDESLIFPRQAKVKPIFPIQNAPRTRRNHDNGLYLAIPLFLCTEFFEI